MPLLQHPQAWENKVDQHHDDDDMPMESKAGMIQSRLLEGAVEKQNEKTSLQKQTSWVGDMMESLVPSNGEQQHKKEEEDLNALNRQDNSGLMSAASSVNEEDSHEIQVVGDAEDPVFVRRQSDLLQGAVDKRKRTSTTWDRLLTVSDTESGDDLNQLYRQESVELPALQRSTSGGKQQSELLKQAVRPNNSWSTIVGQMLTGEDDSEIGDDNDLNQLLHENARKSKRKQRKNVGLQQSELLTESVRSTHTSWTSRASTLLAGDEADGESIHCEDLNALHRKSLGWSHASSPPTSITISHDGESSLF